MANPDHLDIIKRGVKVWNKWREENYGIEPDLALADLHELELKEANLSETDLRNANLRGSAFRGATLSRPISEGLICEKQALIWQTSMKRI